MNKLFTLTVIVLSLQSCKKDNLLEISAEHHFFLENGGAILPVLVQGNTTSNTYIIMLHGGPGDSGINDFGKTGIFSELESDYAMVYYDQRCAGTSQGNCDPQELKVSDFVEDLDKLILTLEHRYGVDSKFFLMGHSWGATLALDYLVHGSQRSKIRACIQSNGSHNIPMLSVQQKESLIHYATQQIALGNETANWQELLNEVQDADPTLEEDRINILQWTYKSEEMLLAVDSVAPAAAISIGLGDVFGNYFSTLTNAAATDNHFLLDLFSYDISSELNQIETPTALYWGKFDLVHPVAMVEDIYSLIGTTDKEICYFNRSFHTPMSTEQLLYQQKVKTFVDEWD